MLKRFCHVVLTRSSCARWCYSLFLGVLMQPLIAESTDLVLTDYPSREGPCRSLTREMEAFKATGDVNGLLQQSSNSCLQLRKVKFYKQVNNVHLPKPFGSVSQEGKLVPLVFFFFFF